MQSAPQELLKQYVQSQHFTSTADIMAAMKEMFRDVIQQVMEVEMDEELGRARCQRAGTENTFPNYRNGYSQKTVKTQLGEIDIKVTRDRKGNFEPKIISKYDRNAEGMEDKILSLYACGMSQKDIAEQIKSLYDVEISPELVSKISEKIMPEVNAWQNRPLENVYPFIFMDAIHYKVKEDHRYVTKAAYVVLGITMDGRKDILGVWIGEHESSKFWLNVLNDLKSRGVLDVYLFCTDGLCGMMQAIQAVYPKSRLQRCIVHQIRSSTKYVSYKDIQKVVADLKKVYWISTTPCPNTSTMRISRASSTTTSRTPSWASTAATPQAARCAVAAASSTSSFSTVCWSLRAVSRISPAVRWRATSPPARSPSIGSSATARGLCAPTSRRVRCCPFPPAALAASASLPFPRWVVSTAMC